MLPLSRGRNLVYTFLDSFGGLKETRLTAAIGYFISISPDSFYNILGIKNDEIIDVKLEEKNNLGRVDILINTRSRKVIVIEAKVSSEIAHEQAEKYKADKRVLISTAIFAKNLKKNTTFVSWNIVANILKKINGEKAKFISNDIIEYLKIHHMINKDEVDEIYIRDIDGGLTYDLFF